MIYCTRLAYRVGAALRRALGLPPMLRWRGAPIAGEAKGDARAGRPPDGLGSYDGGSIVADGSNAGRRPAERMIEALDRSEDNLIRGAEAAIAIRRAREAAQEGDLRNHLAGTDQQGALPSASRVLAAAWNDGEARRLVSSSGEFRTEAWREGSWIEIPESRLDWPMRSSPISDECMERIGLTVEKLLYVPPRGAPRNNDLPGRLRACDAASGPHWPTVPLDRESIAYRLGLALRRALGLPILPWWYRNQLEAAKARERYARELQLRAPAMADELTAFAPRASPDTRFEDLEAFHPGAAGRVPSETERGLVARMLEDLDRSEDNLSRGVRAGFARRLAREKAAAEALRESLPEPERAAATGSREPAQDSFRAAERRLTARMLDALDDSEDRLVQVTREAARRWAREQARLEAEARWLTQLEATGQEDPDDVVERGIIKGLRMATVHRLAAEALRRVDARPEISRRPRAPRDPAVIAALAELRSELEAELEEVHGPEWMREHGTRLAAEWRRVARFFAEIPEPSRA